jgi:hypothetical protein
MKALEGDRCGEMRLKDMIDEMRRDEGQARRR